MTLHIHIIFMMQQIKELSRNKQLNLILNSGNPL